MASSASTSNSSDSTVQSNTNLDLENERFKYDPEVTDLTLIVENQKLHVSKVVLIDASPVFRKMLTGEFKKKNMTELELPEKKYSSFELFLRCIFPREYKLTEPCIDEILPLAGEYEVNCVFQKCENWLLTELEFKEAKVSSHYKDVGGDVKYFMKCLYYGEKYSLKELYKKCFTKVLPYTLRRYMQNDFYHMLPEKNKRELLEMRLKGIEEDVTELNRIGMFGCVSRNSRRIPQRQLASGLGAVLISQPVQEELYKCSPSLFL